MSQIQSLWPAEFGEVKQKTPVAILREQGLALGQMTGNIVFGKVESASGSDRDNFRHFFYLYCSPLSYKIALLYADHGIDLYPAKIVVVDSTPQEALTADDPELFAARLKEIFARERVKRIIASLIAQSKE